MHCESDRPPIAAQPHRCGQACRCECQPHPQARAGEELARGRRRQRRWYRAFLAQPRGAVRIGKDEDEVPVRAVRVRSFQLNDAADAAYATKYTTKANAKYVKGLKDPKRKATTLELLPR